MDIYKFTIPTESSGKFFALLDGIRPCENKISMIDPGRWITNIHVTISEEEVVFLKLGIRHVRVLRLEEAK